ncbi:MAG: hypothetical protein JXA67_22675 [Micromonosporaceae bacterium]|nr:hypothetical protein [Micromonosporaceae bacterium]
MASLDLITALQALASSRPVFHSEADLQHALAWQLQLHDRQTQVRLETRPRRGIHLDLLVRHDGQRTAVELKYLIARLHTSLDGEVFDLPHQAAQDISRYDVVNDIMRVETLVADGYADDGYVLVLSNDAGYWRPGTRTNLIDAAFRLHEGRTLDGILSWAAHAGAGTTRNRTTPLRLRGRYECQWRDYSVVTATDGRLSKFRYLLLPVQASTMKPPLPAAPSTTRPEVPGTVPSADLTVDAFGHEQAPGVHSPQAGVAASSPTPRGRTTARTEILAAIDAIVTRGIREFASADVIAELRRRGCRYAVGTITTMVTSHMCVNATSPCQWPDLERVDRGRYRVHQSR